MKSTFKKESKTTAFFLFFIAFGLLSGMNPDQNREDNLLKNINTNSNTEASNPARSKVPKTSKQLPRTKHTVHVNSSADLTKALLNASAGDHIVLANGEYEGDFTLSNNGTQKAPIIIRAKNPHEANITGTLSLHGTHAWLFQLKFEPGRMQTIGPDTKVLRCKFLNSTSGAIMIEGNAQRAEIACNLVNEYSGTGITVRGPGESVPRDVHIHHNYLLNDKGKGVIYIGLNRLHTDVEVKALIEWNLFENARFHAVHLKSASNIVRFNTLRQVDYPEPSGFVSRHGYNNQFIANVSLNASGVRVRGKYHKVIGNYKDETTTDPYYYHCAPKGTILQDDFKTSKENHQPAGESCFFFR